MPIGPSRMPLMDHLGELRMRLVRIVVVLIIGMVFFYFGAPTITQFLFEPIKQYMELDASGNVKLITLGAFEAFGVRLKVALWTAFVACAPFIIWQILAFFLPALKPRERRWFLPTFFVGVALFFFGAIFCYLIILNPAFEFLTGQAEGFATIAAQAELWIDIILKFELGFGVAFELPLVVFYLTVFEIIPYVKLRESWRVIYVVLLVISAMITPDASPVTMGLMFAAMITLYELSLLMARLVLGKRIAEQKAELEEQARADEEWDKEWAEIKARRAAKKAEEEDEDDDMNCVLPAYAGMILGEVHELASGRLCSPRMRG